VRDGARHNHERTAGLHQPVLHRLNIHYEGAELAHPRFGFGLGSAGHRPTAKPRDDANAKRNRSKISLCQAAPGCLKLRVLEAHSTGEEAEKVSAIVSNGENRRAQDVFLQCMKSRKAAFNCE
jgi:hypothetical protein